jgi:hypothetical protein
MKSFYSTITPSKLYLLGLILPLTSLTLFLFFFILSTSCLAIVGLKLELLLLTEATNTTGILSIILATGGTTCVE